jgi:Protein of unknown function (DUF2948)
MVEDARFEDTEDLPLALQALDAEDLKVMSALMQDAVLPVSEMKWMPRKRRFALLLNRFRWEDRDAAGKRAGKYQRVQAMFVVDSVLRVSSSGIDRRDPDLIISILAMDFAADEDGGGQLTLTLAGDGAVALDLECIDASLRDVTRPYRAAAKTAPSHDLF